MWTSEEEEIIKANKSLKASEIAELVGRSERSVVRKLQRMKVNRETRYPNQYTPGVGGYEMVCQKHPKFSGQSKPTGACSDCWYMYFLKNRGAAPKLPVNELVKSERQVIHASEELHELKRKYRELLKEGNVQDKILEFNANAINALPAVEPPAPFIPMKAHAVESAVLVGSCWHIGEVINKQHMGGLNEYNFDIFCRRLQFLIERTITFTTANMSKHKFEELHVFLTGDMVSGIIHEELTETNDLNIVEQAHLGSLVTAQAFMELAQAFPKVIVTCVVGNHGRTEKSKRFKGKQQINWDYVFYNNLALLLANQKNISFNIPLSFWAGVEVQHHKFLIQHGDLVKSWGGIPFYGITREVGKWMAIKASQKDFFNYWVGSHFHTRADLQTPTGSNILNASLKGGDEYAAGLGLYGDPIQVLFGVHAKYGKTWSIDIKTQYGDKTPTKYHYNKALPMANQTNFIVGKKK